MTAQQEHELGIWGISVLLVTLVFVYTLFFGLQKTRGSQEEILQKQENNAQATATQKPQTQILQIAQSKTKEESKNIPTGTDNEITKNTITPQEKEKIVFTTSSVNDEKGPYIRSVEELFHNTAQQESNTQDLIQQQSNNQEQKQNKEEIITINLYGTHHRKGIMKSAELLGMSSSIKYILKNNENTHFAYMGQEIPDITQKIQALGGKSIAITTEKDIQSHGLFGNTTIFITLPKYIGVKQLFFVQFKSTGDRWFIQVDEDIFEQHKSVLQQIFSAWYTR